MPTVPNSNEPVKPDESIKSGLSREKYVATLGGYPDKKSIEQIDKANSPVGRGKAPGSVRV